MLSRFKEFLGDPANRPAIGIILFFIIALCYFLFSFGLLRLPNFSGPKDEDKKEEISPTPTQEPTPTEEPEEEEPTPKVTAAMKKIAPTSTPKATGTQTPTPSPTKKPDEPTNTPTSGPTNTPTPEVSQTATPEVSQTP